MLTLPDNPDPILLRSARRGDREAWLALVARHAPAVRAAIEARRLGEEDIDRICIEIFERMHGQLFLVSDPNWFHLFCWRTAQAWLDQKGFRPESVPERGPEWMRRLSLSQREAWLMHERFEPQAPFPACEYLGLRPEAYEARWQSSEKLRSEAEGRGLGSTPAGPPADFVVSLQRSLAARLPPTPQGVQGWLQRLPPMPTGLAFLLVLAISALLAALLFQR